MAMISINSTSFQRLTLRAPFLSADELFERIRINSGTKRACEVPVEASHYHSWAHIPKSDWRKPSAREFELLLQEGSECSRDDVVLIKIPDFITAKLRRIDANLRQTTPEYQGEIFPDSSEFRFCRNLIEQIPNLIARDICQYVVATYTWCRRTVSFNPSSGLLVGLHIDSHDHLSMENLGKAHNRMTINVGSNSRYFLFIGLPVESLCRTLLSRGENLSAVQDAFSISMRFLSVVDSYPVVRLEVRPGEAYIAATENVIHDASSLALEHLDENAYLGLVDDEMISIAGYFDLVSPMG